MRIHHLSCGSLCPHGARLIVGEAATRGDEATIFGAHDPHELERGQAAGDAAAA